VPGSLFSTYSQGENRVTASILAAFERLSFGVVEGILQALCREAPGPLLIFANQPTGDEHSRPDARIGASFAFWIETKAAAGAVKKDQLKKHLTALDKEAPVVYQRLIVLTPDPVQPPVIASIDDSRLVWASFDDLVSIIQESLRRDEDVFDLDRRFPTEQESVMLREIVRFLDASRLLSGAENRVLVVPARVALGEYHQYSAYICQPNRSFRPSARMAFYVDKRVNRCIPRVVGQPIDAVLLNPDAIKDLEGVDEATRSRLRKLTAALEKGGGDRFNVQQKVIFLTSPDDPSTHYLAQDVEHHSSSAFVQGQRYVTWAALQRNPKATAEL